MPVARLNGNDLFYEVHGTGRPLVLVHGFGVTSRFWDETVRALGGRYQTIVYDARGHGQSGVPDDLAAYDESVFADGARRAGDAAGDLRPGGADPGADRAAAGDRGRARRREPEAVALPG